MSTLTAPTSSTNALRLENCPQCEYSLQGLPEEGICPECGWAYDRSAVILRCKQRGLLQFNSYVLGIVGAIVAAFAAVIVLTTHSTIGSLAQVLTMLVFIAIMCAMTLIDRATSPRVGDWLLWITPAGIGVQRDFDPDSLLARFRRLLIAVFMPIYLMTGFVPLIFVGRSIFIFFGAIMAVVFGLVYLWLQRTLTPKATISAQGARPALFAWDYVSRIEINGTKFGRYRLAAWRSSWVSRSQRLIDVRINGSDELIAQLRQRISQWYGKEQNAKRSA